MAEILFDPVIHSYLTDLDLAVVLWSSSMNNAKMVLLAKAHEGFISIAYF